MGDDERRIGVGYVKIPEITLDYMAQVLETGRLTYGPFTKEFESGFASQHHLKYATMCNSGTAALQVGLHALKETRGFKANDEVVVPAIGFVADINVVIQNGLKPVLADVDPIHFDLDPIELGNRVSRRTKAVIAVHIGGQPADMTPILKTATSHELAVIEDSCEAMGVKYQGKPVGTFGDLSCFSTYSAHILTTGVGGLVCTNNDELARISRSLVNHGRNEIYTSIDDDDNLDDEERLRRMIGLRFSFDRIGYSARLSELEAAIGLAQLPYLKEWILKRQANARYLTTGLKDLEDYLQLPQIRPGSEHAFMFYPLVVRSGVCRADLLLHLEKAKIETRSLLPLIDQPAYKDQFTYTPGQFPNAERITSQGFYFGCHNGLDTHDLDYVIDNFHQFFK